MRPAFVGTCACNDGCKIRELNCNAPLKLARLLRFASSSCSLAAASCSASISSSLSVCWSTDSCCSYSSSESSCGLKAGPSTTCLIKHKPDQPRMLTRGGCVEQEEQHTSPTTRRRDARCLYAFIHKCVCVDTCGDAHIYTFNTPARYRLPLFLFLFRPTPQRVEQSDATTPIASILQNCPPHRRLAWLRDLLLLNVKSGR